jgi:tRNA/rRNA methyltransferase
VDDKEQIDADFTMGPSAALDRVRVVLVSPSHPGNVGAVARAMKTMGLHDLILAAPRQADIAAQQTAIAFASGATDVLAHARVMEALGSALADCRFALAFTSRRRDLSHGVAPLRSAAQVLARELAADASGGVALVFGSESYGLSNEEVDRCQMIAMIPANPEYASLNLSHAVQLAAYELRLALGADTMARGETRPAASVGEVDGFLDHLERAAIECGFLDPAQPKRFVTRMRRLFTRARMEPEEVAILRGLLAAMLRKR